MPMEAMEDKTILRQNFPLSRIEPWQSQNKHRNTTPAQPPRIFLSPVRSDRLHERPTTRRRQVLRLHKRMIDVLRSTGNKSPMEKHQCHSPRHPCSIQTPYLCSCQETQGRYGAVEATQKYKKLQSDIIPKIGSHQLLRRWTSRTSQTPNGTSPGNCSAATTSDTSNHSYGEIQAPSVCSPTRTKKHPKMCT